MTSGQQTQLGCDGCRASARVCARDAEVLFPRSRTGALNRAATMLFMRCIRSMSMEKILSCFHDMFDGKGSAKLRLSPILYKLLRHAL